MFNQLASRTKKAFFATAAIVPIASLLGGSVAFASDYTAENLSTGPLMPLEVNVLAGAGTENAYKTKSQIVLYPDSYELTESIGYKIKETFSGIDFPSQGALYAAVAGAGEAAEKLYGKLGFSGAKVYKTLFVDFDEALESSTVSLIVQAVDSNGKTRYIPCIVSGDKLTSGSFTAESASLEEFIDLYLDPLENDYIETMDAIAPPPPEEQEEYIIEEEIEEEAPAPSDDSTAPTFSPILNRYALRGSEIDYLSGVYASDNSGAPEITCDSSQVKPSVSGRYPIWYTATDSSGNEAKLKAYITISAVNPSGVFATADGILDAIISDSMSKETKCRKIYDWVKANIRYVNGADKTDSITGAYNAFRRRSGDCYSYYAASEILLTRAGIENLRIDRAIPPGSVLHFWNLAKVGGNWYHFDTTPFVVKGFRDTCLFTEADAQRLTQQRGMYCYVYTKSLYPEVVWN
ncbi:MAG: transglutaminase-like domain-containing protein [Clostridiales bacterium]|jgi:hypothetical protein|nr:transglutaminase-like domain-containing protein [Clostridiales bacterium]